MRTSIQQMLALDLLLPKLKVILEWLLHELRRAQRLLQNDYNVDSTNHDIMLNNTSMKVNVLFQRRQVRQLKLACSHCKQACGHNPSPDCTSYLTALLGL